MTSEWWWRDGVGSNHSLFLRGIFGINFDILRNNMKHIYYTQLGMWQMLLCYPLGHVQDRHFCNTTFQVRDNTCVDEYAYDHNK